MMERKGDWLQTYSGIAFWPLDPRPEDVCIEDIAHALSNLCRYTGHVNRFYSVAEHSVHISCAVSPHLAKWGLLHDAAEAYCNDIARPLKRYLPEYKVVEQRIMEAVCKRFDLLPVEPLEVKEADNRILLDEKAALLPGMPPRHWGLDHLTPLGVRIMGHYPATAEAIFLSQWEKINASAGSLYA